MKEMTSPLDSGSGGSISCARASSSAYGMPALRFKLPSPWTMGLLPLGSSDCAWVSMASGCLWPRFMRPGSSDALVSKPFRWISEIPNLRTNLMFEVEATEITEISLSCGAGALQTPRVGDRALPQERRWSASEGFKVCRGPAAHEACPAGRAGPERHEHADAGGDAQAPRELLKALPRPSAQRQPYVGWSQGRDASISLQ